MDASWLLQQSDAELVKSASTFVHISSFSSNLSSSVSNKANTIDSWELSSKFSSLSKLLRVTAYRLRFVISILRRIASRRNSQFKSFSLLKLEFVDFDVDFPDQRLFISEIDRAGLLRVYLKQRDYFPQELNCLMRSKHLKSSSTLLKLNPLLNKGLIRVGGRLTHAKLSRDNQHPLVLPGRGPLVQLIIRQTHLGTLHGGTQLTLNTLRQRYWVDKSSRQSFIPVQRAFFIVHLLKPSSWAIFRPHESSLASRFKGQGLTMLVL